jgi:hypothetical protein
MANGKPQLQQTLVDVVREQEIHQRKLAGESRANFAGVALSSALAGGTGKRGGADNIQEQEAFLRTAGDTMIGALAFYPTAVTISSGELDISQDTTNAFSTYVYVTGEGATDDTLATITGAKHAGQIIYLQPSSVTALTLTETGGNIQLPGGSNVTINSAKDGASIVKLIYDISIAGGGNKWVLVSNSEGASGGGASFPLEPTVTAKGNVTGATTVNLNDDDGHVTSMTLTGDVTITFSNYPSSGNARDWRLIIDQDATGGHDITWPSEVAEQISISSSANSRTILTFTTIDGGTTVHAQAILRGSITGSANFASRQLDNLSSPVLNVGIDANDKSFSNWVGWTAAVQQTFAINASTATFTLPSGDSYQFNVDGETELEITSAGLVVRESITWNDATADPTADGEIQRNGTALKARSGGNVRDLGKINEDDGTNTWSGINTFTNTLNANGDVNLGDSGADTVAILGDLGSDIIPTGDNTRSLGDSTPTRFAALWVTNVRFDGSTQFITADASGMRFEVPSSDSFNFEVNNVDEFTVSTVLNCHDNSFSNWIGWTAAAGQSDVVDSGGVEHTLPANDTWEWLTAGTRKFLIDPANAFFEFKTDSTTLGVEILLSRDDGSAGANGETLGLIEFEGKTSTNVEARFAYFEGIARDVQNTLKDGEMKLWLQDGNTEKTAWWVRGDQGNGVQLGFRGATPQGVQTYTVTNRTTDRTYDANSTSTAELADVLGTLLKDLSDMGIVTGL